MPTLAEVHKQINAYKSRYIFWTNKEIRGLPQILGQNEQIKAITSGFVNGATWLAVCTQKRVIFFNRNMFFGAQQIQMPLDRIQSIDHEYGIAVGSIRIFDGVNVFNLKLVAKGSILPFVKVTEEMMYRAKHPQQAKPAVVVQATDIASQIAKLAALKENGYLTEDEFREQKRKLLG